jgi:CspA family cold shock protein
MYKGKIKRIVRNRGFGFISAVDGREIFFHRSTIIGSDFDTLKEEQEVEFDVEKSYKGPRAFNLRVTK